MKQVLVTDSGSALGHAVCEALIAAGFGVIAHRRHAGEPAVAAPATHVIGPRLTDLLTGWDDADGPIDHIVFGQPARRSAGATLDDEFADLIERLDGDLSVFLSDLQAAGALLMRRSGSQIWVLTQEDSISYYLDQDTCPIQTRARHAAVKSFAKELFRFGVRLNCATIQTLAEQASPKQWQSARAGLKTFAMKFKPVSAASVARTIVGFLQQDDLPIAGLVMPIGIGFAESNM